jgi:16S rRNA (guanine527-N7)-methyltransferase
MTQPQIDQQRRAFLDGVGVPYETIHRLTRYEEMLICYNEKTNLVASSTLSQIWTRHFLDSAQLLPFIPDTAESLADMGSGAGFPGLVLALVAQDKGRSLRVHAIESIGKKADFLKAIVDELKLDVVVHRERIEDIKDLKADVVTARALKPLPEALKYAKPLMKNNSVCILLKGKRSTEELTQAKKYWTFDVEIHPSRSDDSGKILVLKNLRHGR